MLWTGWITCAGQGHAVPRVRVRGIVLERRERPCPLALIIARFEAVLYAVGPRGKGREEGRQKVSGARAVPCRCRAVDELDSAVGGVCAIAN